ncbi:threonine synthase [Rubrobacter xylanophilus]|uniref:Threonine synthase n=1 Tax=Rubrobacter xylanophilus TaxID=49319 RepID=A0A510HMQ4_9ACTN|nr:threonine synthase [Rubrobacter xylanophilus]BBL80615.1 threonine synthase [Rubrobacter xylanophilus]
MSVQTLQRGQGVIRRWRSWLPEIPERVIADLGEGDTPLVEAGRISERVGARVYLKFEGLNPTASFKDRGMAVAMSRAKATGREACVCASTGNTAASAAAYAARAGMACFVVVPAGKIALGKAVQVLAHGAEIVQIEGNFDAALRLSRRAAEELEHVALVNSVNPDRIEGQKTAAFEVCEALGRPPDSLALPVGNAGNITAYWKGFTEWQRAGRAAGRPRMLGFQAAGAAPLVSGHDIESPETVASAIRIGSPASREGALRAVGESGGLLESVTDAEILDAQELLAREEGVFCEPASAAGVAGLLKLAREGRAPGGTVVCVLTGHGLKDPDAVLSRVRLPEPVPATFEAVSRRLGA